MKKIVLLLVVCFLSIDLFASELNGIGYGANVQEAQNAATENLKNKIKNEIFAGNEEAYNAFNIDEFVDKFTYSDPIITGATKPNERFRMIATLDDRAIRNYVENNLDNATKELVNTTLNQQDASDGGNNNSDKITSYDDFIRNYDANQEQRRKAEQERNVREAQEKAQKARLFRLAWEVGLNIIIPLNNKVVPTGTEYVTGGYGIQAGIGTVINNNIFLMVNAVPTFATKEVKNTVTGADGKETTKTTKISMRYHKTYLDFTAAYRFMWNTSDLYLGAGVGFDVDTAKEFFIMPKIRIGINFDTFKPVFESAAVNINARYTFSTKIWDLGISITLFGLY